MGLFVIDAGFKHYFKNNNISVINTFKLNKDGIAVSDTIVTGVSRMSQFYRALSFSGKFVAHALAKFAKAVNDFILWSENPLFWMKESLL